MSSSPIFHSRMARGTSLIGAFWLSVALLLAIALSLTTDVVTAQGPPGAVSFSQSAYPVNEGDGNVQITLTRTGGSAGQVSAKVVLTDATTSPADYVFKPGLLDPTFPQVPEAIGAFVYYSGQIFLQPDGKIMAGLGLNIVRLNPNGTRDLTFNAPTPNSGVAGFALQSDGKVIVVGNFTFLGGVRKNGVARLNTDGSLDNTFDVGVGSTDVVVVAIQSDDKVLVGGLFSNFNLAPNSAHVVRLNSDGSVDPSFVNQGSNVSTTYALVVQPDGKILIGGLGFLSVARLNADGSLDSTFNCNLAAPTLVLALQPDGKIMAGGGFNHAGSQVVYNITRLNADGSLDSSFNAGSSTDAAVQAVRVQSDGKVLIAGDFTTFNGIARVNVARLNSNGTLDSTFNANLPGQLGSNFIHSMALLPDGKLIVGGVFTALGSGTNRQRLARLHGDLFVTWKDGEVANKTITLPIVEDLLDEPNETLNLSLTALSGGVNAGPIPNATVTIADNDVPPAITSGSPPTGLRGFPYSHTFTATGVPTPTFSVQSGQLPPGLFLQTSGVLSGSPATAGTFSNIVVSAGNGVLPAATQTVSITILSGGTLQFSSSTYNVAENGGPAIITVTRTGGSAGATAVTYSTISGSAGTGTDFTASSGTLNFANGETSKTFAVPLINDSLDEFDETLNLTLSVVGGGSGQQGSPSFATLTITDDDPTPTVTVSDVILTEGNSGTRSAVFRFTLSAASGRNVTINYATANGTATTTSDYFFSSGGLTFAPGVVSRTLGVTVLSDTTVEPDETFFLNLTIPQNVTIARAQAVGTIVNDDNNGGNPTDLHGYFVQQHYLDFLNRQPDTSGFNFWTSQIASCGTDQACIDFNRVNVSGAFFLSIEFQQTGYLVERIYKAAFGNAEGTTTIGVTHQIPVPIVRRSDFLVDTQAIGQGVIVGEPGWESVLENNKQAFATNFVLRSGFSAAYPSSMSPEQFVDTLNTKAGNPLSQSERNQLVNDLSTSAKTRAQVLRTVAEDPDLVSAEFNRAFVLMQYFGYLRRNPNDPQDTDYTGYDFWLTKLDQFNGNFITAEMVKAFLSSIEYRQRFGP